MTSLDSHKLRAALEVLRGMGEGCAGGDDFVRCGLRALPRLIPAELTTLSVCNLETGHRSVVSDSPVAVSAAALETFDAYFHTHPLVRAHGREGCTSTQRINDLLPQRKFRATPLYADYYRTLGIDQVMALPIHVNRRLLVSFVFNRRKVAFTDEERDLADVLCPHLAYLYRLYAAAQGVNESVPFAPSHTAAVLTAREREVLQWVAAGKTNRDVAAILKVGLRTVEKHLEHIYEKLGVETRTAAVMRACAAQRPTRAPSLLVS